MALLTTEQQLEQVQSAITALLAGAQSYTLDGRTITRASLSTLHDREQVLLRRYNQEQGTKPRVSMARFDIAAQDNTEEEES